MIRIILVNLLFLLLPLIIYFAYVLLRQSGEPEHGIVTNAPIFWLLAGGVGLMLIAIVTLGRWEGGEPGKTYVPPQFKDGVVIPGHYE
jgi:uncharacterized membrane protein YedE/YeeE